MILAVALLVGIATCAACQLVVHVPARDVAAVIRQALRRSNR